MAATTTSVDRAVTWEQRTGWLLTGLAVAFLVAYAVPILWHDPPAAVRLGCRFANLVIWAAFGVDYLARLYLTANRWRFVRHHLFDLAVLLLPLIGPLRMLRLITPLTVIGRRAGVWTRGRLSVFLVGIGVLLMVVSSLAVLDAERDHPDASITTFPEALWWSVVTVTTVGYGDYFPVTTAGRLVAVALMIGGIGLIGFVTGSLASWVIERVQVVEAAGQATREDVAALTRQLAEMRTELARLREPLSNDIPDRAAEPATGRASTGPG